MRTMPIDTADLPVTSSLVRAADAGGPALYLWREGRLRGLGTDLDELLAQPLDGIRAVVEAAGPEVDPGALELLAPVASQEVWAAGVTYRRSREARMEESTQQDMYARVYEADRPELFFKAPGWRVVPHGGQVGVRSDSSWDVPEPELAVLSNSSGEVIGFSCGNDMSSRSIEGENPLYLPQAKVYDRSCALGPAAALAWETDLSGCRISMEIARDGDPLFRGDAALSDMVRRPEELSAFLHSALTLPTGAWLLTGTSIVPGSEFTARHGDQVTITLTGLGTLRNTVTLVDVGNPTAPPRIP
jgi:2-dehydro-3-deoxy-D-arabinonate dehydratase